jgi:hypothetical protein
MTVMELKTKTYNFYKRKWGQRDTPFLFFYVLPMFTVSRTKAQEKFSLHIGWLYWNIQFEFLK